MAALAKMLGVAGKVCRGETCGGTIFFLPTTRGAPGDEGEGAVHHVCHEVADRNDPGRAADAARSGVGENV